MFKQWPVAVSAIVAVLLSACGGGGSGSPGLPTTPTPVPTATPTPGPGVAHFTISDPYMQNALSRPKHPNFFSPHTAALYITINGHSVEVALSPTSSQCNVQNGNINCAVDIPSPAGNITFTVQARDANEAPLSTVTGSANISGTTTVPLALDGIWKSATVHLKTENPLMGSASTIPVTVSAYDLDGALIVGPEPFTSPVPLYNSDKSGATVLSKNAVNAPTDSVSLTYNGTSYVNATISAGAPTTLGNGGDTMIPAARIVEYSIPSGSQTWEANLDGKMFRNPNGTLSFAERTPTSTSAIGTVTTSGSITESTTSPFFLDIALGADNNVWGITNAAALAQFSGAGAGFVSAPFPQYPDETLTLGSDGNFWMAAGAPPTPVIQRVTPSGAATDFTLPSGIEFAYGGVLAGDGNVWFSAVTSAVFSGLLSVTPAGQITSYPLSTAQITCCPISSNTVLGPDGQIYFLVTSEQIGRMTTSGTFSSFPIAFAGDTSVGGQVSKNAMGFGPDGALWISTGAFPQCQPYVERVTTSGSYAYVQLPITCNNLNGPAPDVSAFAIGSDGNLWYTRGSYVGKLTP